MIMSKLIIATAAIAAASAVSVSASAANLFVNGGFESGDLTGWTLTDAGSGSWYVNGNGAGTTLNNFSVPTNPGGGSFVANTDQFGPGTHSLSQSFTLAAGAYTLSFDGRGNDHSGAGPAPDQRIYVQVDGADIYSGIMTLDWANYTFNLALGAGAHTISFNETDDRNFFSAGLDNASLSAGVPEPATWTLMIGGFGLAGAALRRRREVAAA